MVIHQADHKKKQKKKKFLSFYCEQVMISKYTQKTPSATYKTLIIFSLFGAVSRKQHTINNICMQELATFFLMKSVFIQSWTISRKYLWSANLPLAMSQMTALKMSWFLPKETHSTRKKIMHSHNVVFPLFLQTHYIRNLVVV